MSGTLTHTSFIDQLEYFNINTVKSPNDPIRNSGTLDQQDPSMDEVFLKKLRDVIEANIESTDFGVDDLCREIGMSRSQLHRRLQTLTSKSTSRYIRSFKLEKARDLLRRTWW